MGTENRVSPDSAGSRLDVFLAQSFPEYSRSFIQRLVETGAVLVNGSAAKKREILRENDLIQVQWEDRQARPHGPIAAEDIPIEVVYEDEYFLAVNKPAGIVVHPGNGNRSGTLVNALAFHRADHLAAGFSTDRPGIVHRLDKETSGVILVAKTDQAHAALARLFAAREIDKQYLGICVGRRPPDHGMIEAPLARSRREPLRRTVMEGGKDAITEYWLIAYRHAVAALRFRLHTGRTHQIRVHCEHANFSIIHDPTYGGGEAGLQRVEPLERPFAWKIYKCFNRQALHAWRISFIHPINKKQISIVAPVPDDMKKALELLGAELPAFPSKHE